MPPTGGIASLPPALAECAGTALDPHRPVADRCCAARDLQDALTRDGVEESQQNTVIGVFVQIAADAAQPKELRDVAAVVLGEEIRKAARLATVSSPGQHAEDLRNDAEGVVYTKLRGFAPERGLFLHWCYAVLRNEFITRLRQRKNNPFAGASSLNAGLGEGSHPEAPDADQFRSRLERALDSERFLTAPFSDADLGAIAVWSPLDRLLLLGLSGLWVKIDPGVWEGWVRTAGIEEQFPPGELPEVEGVLERLALIAAVLGMSEAAGTRRWYRGRAALGQLEAIRSIQP